jgi:hypothetical protein
MQECSWSWVCCRRGTRGEEKARVSDGAKAEMGDSGDRRGERKRQKEEEEEEGDAAVELNTGSDGCERAGREATELTGLLSAAAPVAAAEAEGAAPTRCFLLFDGECSC